jgi:hypothetical protein
LRRLGQRRHLGIGGPRFVDRRVDDVVGLLDLAGNFSDGAGQLVGRVGRGLGAGRGVVRCFDGARRALRGVVRSARQRDRGRFHCRRAVAECLEQRFRAGAERCDRRVDDAAALLLLDHVVALLPHELLLGDVLVGGNPAAAGYRLVAGLNHAAIRSVDEPLCGLTGGDIGENLLAIVLRIAGEPAGLLAVLDQPSQRAARLHHVGRQFVHAQILLIADDDSRGSVEHAQALRHMV